MATSRAVSIQSQNLNKSMEIYFQYYLGRFYRLKKKKSIENPYLSNTKHLPSLKENREEFQMGTYQANLITHCTSSPHKTLFEGNFTVDC